MNARPKLLSLVAVGALFVGCASVNEPFEPPVVRAPADLGPNPCQGIVPEKASPPIYPMRALRNGTWGFVVAEFDIEEDGKPAMIRVADSEPAGVFDDAVLASMEHWRFPDEYAGRSDCRYRVDMKIIKGSQAKRLSRRDD